MLLSVLVSPHVSLCLLVSAAATSDGVEIPLFERVGAGAAGGDMVSMLQKYQTFIEVGDTRTVETTVRDNEADTSRDRELYTREPERETDGNKERERTDRDRARERDRDGAR